MLDMNTTKNTPVPHWGLDLDVQAFERQYWMETLVQDKNKQC